MPEGAAGDQPGSIFADAPGVEEYPAVSAGKNSGITIDCSDSLALVSDRPPGRQRIFFEFRHVQAAAGQLPADFRLLGRHDA